MKTTLRLAVTVSILLLSNISQHLFAQLTVQDPTIYGTKLGYIDAATLVAEPHGGYVEQSLYLKYSDHNQYPGNQNIEIVHRFTLPQGSVINDLWLWIDTLVIKAKMYDTWTARHIYDSIVTRRHDPAFLAKNGNTYELHIYPLVSGQFRKIKLNFISPTRWIGTNGSAELPLQFLKNNNAQIKPLEVLFREKEEIWGSPFIAELPQLSFVRTVDTAGYRYRNYEIADISSLTSLSVAFQVQFNDGIYITAGDRNSDTSYFQIGIDPGSFQIMRSDTGARSVVVGLDLGGSSYKDFSTLIPNINKVLHQALRPIDRFRLTASGGGTVEHISPWRNADSTSIDTVLQNFASGPFAAQWALLHEPRIIFCDYNSQTIWRFPALDSVANIGSYGNIVQARPAFHAADIVASYDHGFETADITAANLTILLPSIDSLFLRGGRFLGYFDHNRPGGEKIETHYINGLTVNYVDWSSQTLFRQSTGNIGAYFPASVTVNNANYLKFDDPEVKVELANSAGDAAVISKRINKGLLVVSGLWSFVEDGAIKQMLAVPLLGVTQFSQGPQMLRPLLNDVKTTLGQDTVHEVILFSDADSMISKSDADAWVNEYLLSMSGTKPVFYTVNLLDGRLFTPGYLTDNSIDYFGSGYLLKLIAEGTNGIHSETHIRDWGFIAGTLTYSPLAPLDSLNINVSVDSGLGRLIEMREVDPEPNDPVKPRFFIGASNAGGEISFDIVAKFEGTLQEITKQVGTYVTRDTTKRSPVIAGMLGWEKLQDYFQTEFTDTISIVNLAIQFNLLCDYTALIALEPSDVNPPLLNPFDESKIFTGFLTDQTDMNDSLLFIAFPNPFNSQTNFRLNLPQYSDIHINIYNVLGQEVKSFLLSDVHGNMNILWDGTDESKRSVASGIYYVKAMIREKKSSMTISRTVKLLMLK